MASGAQRCSGDAATAADSEDDRFPSDAVFYRPGLVFGDRQRTRSLANRPRTRRESPERTDDETGADAMRPERPAAAAMVRNRAAVVVAGQQLRRTVAAADFRLPDDADDGFYFYKQVRPP